MVFSLRSAAVQRFAWLFVLDDSSLATVQDFSKALEGECESSPRNLDQYEGARRQITLLAELHQDIPRRRLRPVSRIAPVAISDALGAGIIGFTCTSAGMISTDVLYEPKFAAS